MSRDEPTKVQRLIDAIQAAGTIRTPALAEATGIKAGAIQSLLATAERKGEVLGCTITRPGQRPVREYRIGSGVANTFTPLNPRKTRVAVRHHNTEAGTPPAAALQPQPAVGLNTGSTSSDAPHAATPPRGVPSPKPPKPTASAPGASGRDVHPKKATVDPYFAVDTQGALVIDLPRLATPLVLDAVEHHALRRFFHATTGVIPS